MSWLAVSDDLPVTPRVSGPAVATLETPGSMAIRASRFPVGRRDRLRRSPDGLGHVLAGVEVDRLIGLSRPEL